MLVVPLLVMIVGITFVSFTILPIFGLIMNGLTSAFD
jgi:hypothetical protein